MLDVKTLKILRFLNEHPDETFSSYQMEKCGVPADGETLDWLYKAFYESVVARLEG